jgi:methylmalonyl-CoA mutase cobalamin-binding subunit
VIHLYYFLIAVYVSLPASLAWGQSSTSPVFPSFQYNKVQIEESNRFAFQKASNQNLKLMLIALSGCRDLRSVALISRNIRLFDLPLKVAAHSIEVDSDSQLPYIRDMVTKSECLLGLTTNPIVRSVFANVRRLDPLETQQLALPSIHLYEAESIFFHPVIGIRKPPVVAILDSGVDRTHLDLKNHFWKGSAGEIGIDLVNADSDPSDDFGHGTHVAGIIGAQSGNGIGVRGVMGSQIQLQIVKSQGPDGDGSLADVVNGILWAADHGADVLNISLTANSGNAALKDAIEYAISKNVTVVTASGNNGEALTSQSTYAPISYAAGLDGLIGVGAIEATSSERAGFSNYGVDVVELGAPGTVNGLGILSTFLNSTYMKISGTSMACPHVSGAAALLSGFYKTHGIEKTSAQIEADILASSKKVTGLQNAFQNGRSLDVLELAKWALKQGVLDSDGGFDAPP